MFPLSLAPGLAGSYRLSLGEHRSRYLGVVQDSIFMMTAWGWKPSVKNDWPIHTTDP